jgi:hypothetical protein
MLSMTRRFSISLPDDVAAVLDEVDNASAYIAEAIRRLDRRNRVDDMLKRHGYEITEEGVARMRERVRAQEARLRRYLAEQPRESGK